jgi:hypothetical protein
MGNFDSVRKKRGTRTEIERLAVKESVADRAQEQAFRFILMLIM